jgi:hypothetical protein
MIRFKDEFKSVLSGFCRYRWACGHSTAGSAGSNPAEVMNVCIVCVLHSKDKRYNQENQDKEVQIKCKDRTKTKQKKNPSGGARLFMLCVVV